MAAEVTVRFLHELVVDTSDATAVSYWDGIKGSSISYAELQEVAHEVCEEILKKQFEENAIVAVYMETNLFLPAVILGIMKAGCCFLYLSPQESSKFTQSLLKRVAVNAVISDNPLQYSEYEMSGKCAKNMYVYKSLSKTENFGNLLPLAYVMFTSGTTGPLKIVKVPHSCILPNICDFRELFQMSSKDRVFLSSPLSFDPSIIEIFLALSTGACLVMVSDRIRGDAVQLAKVLFEKYFVTVLQTTPSLLTSFSDDVITNQILGSESRLRVLALGGERFPVHIFRKLTGISIKPAVYNLYGITEVSCWATCYKFDPGKELSPYGVPLGLPLTDTSVKVEKLQGDLKDSHYGVLYVGGTGRICYVDQNTPIKEAWRCTGDVVIQDENGNMFFLERTDDQTKRLGKKLNVEQISAILADHDKVSQVVVIVVGKTLVAFAVIRREGEKESEYRSLESLQAYAKQSLPRHCWPDVWHTLASIPATKHGKVDKRKLQLMANALINLPPFEKKFIKPAVSRICESILGICIDGGKAQEKFSSWGLDSLKALQIAEMLQKWSAAELVNAVDVLLHRTVKDLWMYVESVCFTAKSRPLDFQPVTKKLMTEAVQNSLVQKTEPSVIHRFAATTLMRANRAMWGNQVVQLRKRPPEFLGVNLTLRHVWRWDSEKCIDASPLVVTDQEKLRVRIFIGSHSGRFACLDAVDGSCVWLQTLSDRIEASAIVSGCGRYVIVGCYDGSVYFLNIESGSIFWRYLAGDAVKTSAVLSSYSGFVYVGSHDRNLHLLDVENKTCVYKTLLDGAIFSTPIVCCERSTCFVATLAGSVYALQEASWNTDWKRSFNKPFFSNLALHGETLFAACTDHAIYLLNAGKGDTIRTILLNGPIFSSPSLFSTVSNGQIVYGLFVGCHDTKVYSFLEGGIERVVVGLDSEVFASPFVFELSDLLSLVCIVSKSGNLCIIDAETGALSTSFLLPGEAFSSPVVCGDRIFLGCRDNGLHCVQLIRSDSADAK